SLDVADGRIDLGERHAQMGRFGHLPSMDASNPPPGPSAPTATLPPVFRQEKAPRARRGIELMEAHIEELCREHGIELAGASSRGRAIRWRGGRLEISIPPIRGQVSYFIALHEIGHLVGRGRSAPRLESEANAWLWALEHSAIEPTEATKRSISRRLRGYL